MLDIITEYLILTYGISSILRVHQYQIRYQKQPPSAVFTYLVYPMLATPFPLNICNPISYEENGCMPVTT